MINKKTEKDPKASKGAGRVANVIAFIMCFIISFFVWFYVMQTDSPEHEEVFSLVAVKIDNVTKLSQESNLSVINGWDSKVDVTVRGRRSDIAAYTSADVMASVDVGSVISNGVYTLNVKVVLPDGLQLVSCTPSTISVEVDKVSTKPVPVIPKIIEVKHDAECELGDPVANPAEIIVTGPVSVLEKIEAAEVRLDLGEITGSVVAVSRVTVVDKNGDEVVNPYIAKNVDSVSVTVPLYEKKTVPLEVAFKHGYYNSENCEITVDPAFVTLRGEHAALQNIESILLKTIDEKQVTSDKTETVTVSVPAGTVAEGNITSAKITIKHIGTYQRTLTVTEFDIRGSGYTLVTEELDIILRGPESLLRRLTADDITVSVPLSEIEGTGQLRVEAVVTVASQYADRIYELGTYYIQIIKK